MSDLRQEVAAAIAKVRFAAAPHELNPPAKYLLDQETDAVMCVVEPLAAAQAKFDERLSDLQAEYLKHQQSWDRTRKRLGADVDMHMQHRMEIEQILNVELGTEVEDGADAGFVADVALALQRRKAERDLAVWLHAEAVWQRDQLRVEADHQWTVRRQLGHRLIDTDSELTEAVDLARWLLAESAWRLDRTLPELSYWRDVVAPTLSDMLRGMARLSVRHRLTANAERRFRRASETQWVNERERLMGQRAAARPDADRETLVRLSAIALNGDVERHAMTRWDTTAERVVDALIAAGYVCTPGHEWQCPGCGATTRARMADYPTASTP